MSSATKEVGTYWYIAKTLDGSLTMTSRLSKSCMHKTFDSVEEVRGAIDDRNMAHVERGEDAKQYLICKETYHTVWGGDGVFIGSSDVVQVIEKYPSD